MQAEKFEGFFLRVRFHELFSSQIRGFFATERRRSAKTERVQRSLSQPGIEHSQPQVRVETIGLQRQTESAMIRQKRNEKEIFK